MPGRGADKFTAEKHLYRYVIEVFCLLYETDCSSYIIIRMGSGHSLDCFIYFIIAQV